MNRLRTAVLAAAASLALVAVVTPSASAHAVETVDLSRPGSLERGDDVRLPHLEGTTLVDGELRIEVPNAITLLGPSDDHYLVSTRDSRGVYRVKRVAPDGSKAVLLRGRRALYTALSDDGRHLIGTDNRRLTTLAAYDATDGSEVARRTFRSRLEVLDVDGGVVLASSWERPRTLTWDLATGARERVSSYVAYQGDLSADRLALYTDDPYEGGCSLVTRPSAAGETLWESCRQKVATFSEDGERLVTMHILTDGAGPGELQLRETDGTRLTTYAASWFGSVGWEDVDTLLLDANGRRNGALVRCDLAVCELASDVAPSVP